MFKIIVKCPHKDCGKSLEDKDNLVSNTPSIHLKVLKDGQESDIYLSSIYGDYNSKEGEGLDLYIGDIVKFMCPHCKKELPVLEQCSCGADIVEMELESGGMVKFCTRKGCHYHNLSFEESKDLYDFLERSGYKDKK